ncbi:hypothetical protein IPV08_24200 [Methylobacterium sp. SD274]|uniref:hypothetical protein n=1 Tax=Methylobacterium sp. SD274 TaxID=2782009 RepID=UPI001A97A82E|nr:hypothetical protein [Methylobacterium sp. SD274]MBO1023059.1 hypothetical protein [Methylobacterium sp. SD274]
MAEQEIEPLGKRRLCWPAPGDRLFTASGTPDDSFLGHSPFGNHGIMTAGYRGAADALVEKTREGSYEKDSLVFPIIFLYRQFIELELKGIIASYGRRCDVPPNWQSHRLDELWKSVHRIMEYFEIEDVDGANTAVGEVIREFAAIDPNSFSFRYPVTRDGKPILYGDVKRVDLLRLKEVMEGVANLLSGTDCYIDDIERSGYFEQDER